MFTNHAEHLPSLDVDALNIHLAARSFSLFLVEAAKASIPFGRLGRFPKAWWSQEAESAVREQRGPAPRHTDLRRTASGT